MNITNITGQKDYGELLSLIAGNLDLWVFIINDENKLLWANKKFLTIISRPDIKSLQNKADDGIPVFNNPGLEKKIKLCCSENTKIIEETEIEINNKKYTVKLKLLPFSQGRAGTFPQGGSEENSILGLIEDVSGFSALTKETKNTNRLMDNVFNSVRVYSIITTDKDFLVQKFNKGAELLLEYAAPEAENKLNIKQFFPIESEKDFQEIIEALKVLNLVRREVKMINKNSGLADVDLTVSKIMSEQDVIEGYIFMASDITEHKRLKTNLEKQTGELIKLYNDTQKANKAKSFFLANMSHEFRTPLTAILGFSELMMDEKAGALSGTQKEFLNDIYLSGKHLLDLINDVLDLSKIEAERMEVDIEKIMVQDVINSAKTFILPDVKKKNIELIDRIPGQKILVMADESRLKQSLYNIYSNAAKFTNDNGKIITEVRVEEKNDLKEVKISISDTGIGIKQDDQEMIFEEFLQIETPYSKKYTGTGLGLALVKKFIEMMKGTVEVFSEGEDKGSTFTISLPLSGQ